jgi:hypothetical protein
MTMSGLNAAICSQVFWIHSSSIFSSTALQAGKAGKAGRQPGDGQAKSLGKNTGALAECSAY